MWKKIPDFDHGGHEGSIELNRLRRQSRDPSAGVHALRSAGAPNQVRGPRQPKVHCMALVVQDLVEEACSCNGAPMFEFDSYGSDELGG